MSTNIMTLVDGRRHKSQAKPVPNDDECPDYDAAVTRR